MFTRIFYGHQAQSSLDSRLLWVERRQACIGQGRLCTWIFNYKLYRTDLRYYIDIFPLWSQIKKDPTKVIKAPKFTCLNKANKVIDTTTSNKDLEEEVVEAEEEEDSD